ncbi:MAG: undecaprenyl-diphosphate phosphatase [Legionellales bacterium]|jgi:undecaprenyl-diphosphatase
MDLLQVILLAVIQGLTEFLPVSSSAHLILLSTFMHYKDQGLVFDVALHMGTLIAVLFYFRRELRIMIRDWVLSCMGRGQTAQSRLMWALGFTTIPVGLAGLLFSQYISTYLRDPVIIAFGMIVFGIFLGFADKYAKQTRTEYQLNWKDILVIGIAQALALIPGASRSGTTMTAGLIMGLSKEASSRFSFLLSIPVIVLAGGHEASQMTQADWANTQMGLLLLAVALSAVTAFAVIYIFLKLIERMGMMPFVIYRLLLGALLLFLFW